jgi:hypothetical protein
LYCTLAGVREYEEMLRLLLISLRPVMAALRQRLRLLVITAEGNLEHVLAIVNEVVPEPSTHRATVHVLAAPDSFTAAVNKLAVGRLTGLPLLQSAPAEVASLGQEAPAPAAHPHEQPPQQQRHAAPLYERVVYMDLDMLALPPSAAMRRAGNDVDAAAAAVGGAAGTAGGGSRRSADASAAAARAGPPQQQLPEEAEWPLLRLLRLPLREDTLYAPGEPSYDMDHDYFSLHRYDTALLALWRSAGGLSSGNGSDGAAGGEGRSNNGDAGGSHVGVDDQSESSQTGLPNCLGGACFAPAPAAPPRELAGPRRPFNTGFFMFRPSLRMLAALDAALDDALATPRAQRPPFCMEQPYLNHHLHTRDQANWTALLPHIVVDTKHTAREGEALGEEAAVIHVTGLSASPHRMGQRKLARMQALFLRLLDRVPRADLLR